MFVVVAPTLPATQIKMKSPGLLVPALQELLAGTKTVPWKDDMVSQEPNEVPNHILVVLHLLCKQIHSQVTVFICHTGSLGPVPNCGSCGTGPQRRHSEPLQTHDFCVLQSLFVILVVFFLTHFDQRSWSAVTSEPSGVETFTTAVTSLVLLAPHGGVRDLRNLLMTGMWLLWSFRYRALNPSKDTRMRGGLEKLGGQTERNKSDGLNEPSPLNCSILLILQIILLLPQFQLIPLLLQLLLLLLLTPILPVLPILLLLIWWGHNLEFQMFLVLLFLLSFFFFGRTANSKTATWPQAN